jgi:hypothetical protein
LFSLFLFWRCLVKKYLFALVLVLVMLVPSVALAHPRYVKYSTYTKVVKANKKLAAELKVVRRQKAAAQLEFDYENSVVEGAVLGAVHNEAGWHFGEYNSGRWISYLYSDQFIISKGLWLEYDAFLANPTLLQPTPRTPVEESVVGEQP